MEILPLSCYNSLEKYQIQSRKKKSSSEKIELL